MRTIRKCAFKWLFFLLVLIILWGKRLKLSTLERLTKFFPFLKPFVQWLKKVTKDKELRLFWSIFLVNLIFKELIDAVLTPFLIIEFGYKITLLTTILIYAFIGIYSVKLYDKKNKEKKGDPLKIEALKKAQCKGKEIKNKNMIINFILKRNKKNKIILFILGSFKNPGLPVLYLRDGYNLYNGFAGKWIKFYFLLGLLIINFYWVTMVYLGISFWKPIWNLIKFIIFVNFKIYI